MGGGGHQHHTPPICVEGYTAPESRLPRVGGQLFATLSSEPPAHGCRLTTCVVSSTYRQPLVHQPSSRIPFRADLQAAGVCAWLWYGSDLSGRMCGRIFTCIWLHRRSRPRRSHALGGCFRQHLGLSCSAPSRLPCVCGGYVSNTCPPRHRPFRQFGLASGRQRHLALSIVLSCAALGGASLPALLIRAPGVCKRPPFQDVRPLAAAPG